jgi:hypothetical protein
MRRLAGPLLGGLLPVYAALLSAEYVSSSSPVPLLVGFNVLAYVPYYIVLLAVIGRAGPLSVRSLYLFGAVLGLGTESFITKVAWAHPAGWAPVLGQAGGFGPWELAVLVFTYHPLLSVLVPVMLCGDAFGLPRGWPLAPRARRLLLAALPVLTGAFAAFAGQPPAVAGAALAVNAVTLTALVAAWRRWGAPPRRIAAPWLAAAVACGVFFAAAALPVRYTPAPGTLLATIAVLVLLALAFARSVRRDAVPRAAASTPPASTPPAGEPAAREPAAGEPAAPPVSFGWRGYLTYLAGFAVVSWACYLVLTLAGGPGRVVVALLALAGGIAGTGYLLACVARALLPESPRRRPHTAGGGP